MATSEELAPDQALRRRDYSGAIRFRSAAHALRGASILGAGLRIRHGPFAPVDRTEPDVALRRPEDANVGTARASGVERRTVNDEEIEARCVYRLIDEGAKILPDPTSNERH